MSTPEVLVMSTSMSVNNTDVPCEGSMQTAAHDLNQIWEWNHELPPTHSFCMHENFSEQAERLQHKVAVSAWDGDLTYAQIERYSSSTAHALRRAGVQLHDVLPICFEKSAWTIVAVLAAMKAGATFVLMDPTLPLARLQNMAEQVGVKGILTSRKQHQLSASIKPEAELFIVDVDTCASQSDNKHDEKLPTVPPSALMYIIFTSGSTGVPKGVMISHEAYSSSALPRAEAVGYTEDSRVLDFASYAFDVSIDSMLLTLSHGGCLCIPSDQDRLNDINGVIRKMRVNYAGLTPSVARILDSDVISSLTMLGLGGEAVTVRDVNRWGALTRIVIGYGPCECTIGCTINSSAATGKDYISIGRGNGACIWIVDPDNHERLVPVGEVGELLVEGPIVGQGYLHDNIKTEAAFISDPSWLTVGYQQHCGRRGRLYKSGDLVRYDPEGSGDIIFVGRKDTQVKLRGQRVELGEIEWQLQNLLPSGINVVAEVVVPERSGEQAMLMAFVTSATIKDVGVTLELVAPAGELQEVLPKIDSELAKVLPRYMVPTVYLTVNYIPVLISGKTDRKRLRSLGATVNLQHLEKPDTQTASNRMSELEIRLRMAWSRILGLAEGEIRSQSNFFGLGGDSVAAMKLVAICREQGLDLAVVNVFRYPTLTGMAVLTQIREGHTTVEVPAFSMISQAIEDVCIEAARACQSERSMIEDVYPCTPGQESLFTFSIKSTTPYLAQRLARIPKHIDLADWKSAWEKVVAATPILRTRLIQSHDSGLRQVVLHEGISWKHATNLAQYLEQDQRDRMDVGQSLARYAIIEDANDDQRYMVWTIHHAVYDGWSEPLILGKVSRVLQDQKWQLHMPVQMKDLVRHLLGISEVSMQEFWQRELQGAIGPQFPDLPHRDYIPKANTKVERQLSLKPNLGSPFTMATYIRGALPLVVSQYTGSDDIVLSETLTGREIAVTGVESIEGPLITTIPIRTRVSRAETVEAYLQSVQQSMAARSLYGHYGMQNIRRVSHDAQYACEARIGLVIHPQPEYTGDDLGFEKEDVVHEALKFNPYPLMLACETQKEGLRVCASFDSNIVSTARVERFLAQLEVVSLELTKHLDRKVGEIPCVSLADLERIWRWNETPPLSFDVSSQRFRADQGKKTGSSYPPLVVPWVCDPRNPSLLSPIGCVGELWLEGTLLSGNTCEAPRWLVAGSSQCPGRTSRVQSTGDLVHLQDDGSLKFIGRKEDIMSVQGHNINLLDLEAQLAKHLPSTVIAAAAVCERPSTEVYQTSQYELIALIEQQPDTNDVLRLMSAETVVAIKTLDMQISKMTVCPTASADLIEQIKKLDRALRNSLPPYMVPAVYVLVDRIPRGIDHKSLNQLASGISSQTLSQLRKTFDEIWMKSSVQKELTIAENILRAAWAEVLKINERQIDLDDNFFRLGADSVLAMRLVSNLRVQGHVLTVAEIFQNMGLRDAAAVLQLNQASKQKSQAYRAFSTLGSLETPVFVSEVVRPKLTNPAWTVQDVLPVTATQAMDVRATIRNPRTSIQYTMLYFDDKVDTERLHCACKDLIKAHDILRTIFIEHNSTLLQVVLDELDAPFLMHQTEAAVEDRIDSLCRQDAESEFHLGSSFLRLILIEGREDKSCLVIRLSHAQYDGGSLPTLLRDLEMLYAGGTIVDVEPFPAYMARICDVGMQTKAVAYWRNLLKGSSLSMSILTPAHATDKSIFLKQPVDISQRPKEITIANLVIAAWALTLARHLQVLDVTFGGVTSGRQLDMRNADKVMGPCYQFTPIRAQIQSHWTAMDLMQFVQKQCAQSAAYDFLGFEKTSKQCTRWTHEVQGFDSLVHHQDFEDFDTMSFAGKNCKVDILNPHGDAAYPFKIASYYREGQLYVGVVGSERENVFAQTMLDNVVSAIKDLAIPRPEIEQLRVLEALNNEIMRNDV